MARRKKEAAMTDDLPAEEAMPLDQEERAPDAEPSKPTEEEAPTTTPQNPSPRRTRLQRHPQKLRRP